MATPEVKGQTKMQRARMMINDHFSFHGLSLIDGSEYNAMVQIAKVVCV